MQSTLLFGSGLSGLGDEMTGRVINDVLLGEI